MKKYNLNVLVSVVVAVLITAALVSLSSCATSSGVESEVWDDWYEKTREKYPEYNLVW